MFLLEPQRTAYDLNWRMFGVPVRVHPMFWLFSAIMGFGLLQDGLPPFLVWMACVFFSLLIHELGHVFMFRVCGVHAHVVLYAFGGLAIPFRRLHERWQRIAVSFAGPFAEFLIVGAVAVALAFADPMRLKAVNAIFLAGFGIRPEPFEWDPTSLLNLAILILVEINIFWGVLNLLPIYPLDGGQISRDFLDGLMPGGHGVRMALGISLVLAGVLTLHCIMAANGKTLIPYLPAMGSYAAIMFGMLAIQSFQLLQMESNPPWRREG